MVVNPGLPVQALGSTKPILLHNQLVFGLTSLTLQVIVSHGWKVGVQVQGMGTMQIWGNCMMSGSGVSSLGQSSDRHLAVFTGMASRHWSSLLGLLLCWQGCSVKCWGIVVLGAGNLVFRIFSLMGTWLLDYCWLWGSVL